MKPVFDTKMGSIYMRTVRSFSMVMIITMLTFGALVMLSSSHAWSFEAYYGHLSDDMAVQTSKAAPVLQRASYHSSKLKTSSIRADSHTSSAADTCLPLLTSIRHTSPQNAMDRSRRSAGKAAAVGLIFGVRFALTPPEMTRNVKKPKANLSVWQTEPVAQDDRGNRSALAVAAYRQCQKQKALNSFRLSR